MTLRNVWTDDMQILRLFNSFSVISGECAGGNDVVVVLLFYVHGKHLRS